MARGYNFVFAAIALLAAAPAPAQTGLAAGQIAPARTLAELTAEVLVRAERQIYPLSGVTREEAAEGAGRLTSLSPDVWADAFMPIGDRLMEQARAAGGPDARALYRRAFTLYSLARFPYAGSPRKAEAYTRALAAFRAFDQLSERPAEVLRIPFEGKEIVAYLRLPAGAGPAPVVFFFGGIDFLKEQASEEGITYLPMGVAVLNIDIPGTGQSPIKASPDAGRLFSAVLDYIATRPELDAKRVILRGVSWGGYWAAKMAIVERARLIGSNSQGGPAVEFFSREWQLKALGTREYLIDLFGARSVIYGTPTLEEFLAFGPQMSLAAQGLLDKPSAPMLLINGTRDTQVPIADLVALQMNGSPKEAYVIPGAGHVGIGAGWSPKRVNDEVVLPWIRRLLASGARSPA